MLRKIMRKIVPGSVKRAVENRLRAAKFSVALREYRRLSPAAAIPRELLERLVGAWGNDWSAGWEYLDGLLRNLAETSGPVLECGSGLTTLLVGIRCQSLGRRLWALEHQPEWAAHIRGRLARYGVDAVAVCDAPLVGYGDYIWYDPSGLGATRGFSIVVCDGPPGDTKGGRYGLLPVLADRLAPGCRVLLDDVCRPGEQEVVARWSETYAVTSRLEGVGRPFAVVGVNESVVPGVTSHRLSR